MGKISKQAAGYVHFEGTNYHCEECYKFAPEGACAEVEGRIAAIGGCNTFVFGKAGQIIAISLPRKLSKMEAGYTENKAGFACKRCEYFNRKDWDCKKVDKDSTGVDKGLIHPNACCNNWERSEVFGGM